MKLGQGTYKIKSRLGYERMRVYYNDKKELVYSISSTPEKPLSSFEDDNPDTQVLKKIHHLDPVLHAKLHISWKDQELDEFKLSATSTTRFRQILDDLDDVMAVLKDKRFKR